MFAMRNFLYLIALVLVGLLSGENGFIVDSVYAEGGGKFSPSVVGHVISEGEDKGGCVGPTLVMRKKHMDFLFRQRDDTMYHGIRTGPYSLKECVGCHVKKDEQGREVPVNAPGQDCQRCHQYVAVDIDCFGCHAATSISGLNP